MYPALLYCISRAVSIVIILALSYAALSCTDEGHQTDKDTGFFLGDSVITGQNIGFYFVLDSTTAAMDDEFFAEIMIVNRDGSMNPSSAVVPLYKHENQYECKKWAVPHNAATIQVFLSSRTDYIKNYNSPIMPVWLSNARPVCNARIAMLGIGSANIDSLINEELMEYPENIGIIAFKWITLIRQGKLNQATMNRDIEVIESKAPTHSFLPALKCLASVEDKAAWESNFSQLLEKPGASNAINHEAIASLFVNQLRSHPNGRQWITKLAYLEPKSTFAYRRIQDGSLSQYPTTDTALYIIHHQYQCCSSRTYLDASRAVILERFYSAYPDSLNIAFDLVRKVLHVLQDTSAYGRGEDPGHHLYTKRTDPFLAYAKLYQRKNQNDSAIVVLRTGFANMDALEFRRAILHNALGDIFKDMGNADSASVHYIQTLQIIPELPDVEASLRYVHDSLYHSHSNYTAWRDSIISYVELPRVPLPANFPILSLSNNKPLALASSRHDSITVIEFFSTTCAPCIHSIELMREYLSLPTARRDVRFVLISSEQENAIAPYMKSRGIPFQYVQNGQHIMSILRVSATPDIFFIDKQGRIVRRVAGIQSVESLHKMLVDL